MGSAYDFAFRPIVGNPDDSDGGSCDDRPRFVELYGAAADRTSSSTVPRTFSLCPEHELQLRRYDERIRARGVTPRFRYSAKETGSPARGG